MAARKPTKLSAPATITAIQLAQNGTSTPFKVTDHPITIRINCRSAISAKMAAASAQKVLVVIDHLRWPARMCSSLQPVKTNTNDAKLLRLILAPIESRAPYSGYSPKEVARAQQLPGF